MKNEYIKDKITLNMNKIVFPDITDKNELAKKCMTVTEWEDVIKMCGISNTSFINEMILGLAIDDGKIVYVFHKPSGKVYRGIITSLEDPANHVTLTIVMSEGNKNPNLYTINSDIISDFEVYMNEPTVCAAVK